MLRRLTAWFSRRKTPRTRAVEPEVTDVVQVLEPYANEFSLAPLVGLWIRS